MSGHFLRTTVSFTGAQMDGMKKLVEDGEYPDLTEATRAAVNLFLDLKKFPSIAHALCCATIRHGICLKLREECRDCENIQVPALNVKAEGDLSEENCTKKAVLAVMRAREES